MAYKQNAGRGMMPKTGRGLSPTLMSGSPMKQTSDPEYTKTGYDKLKNIKKNLKDKEGRASIEKVQGVIIDPATGKASAKPYEKSYSAGKSGQQDRVMTGDKKIAKSSSTKKGIDFGKKELRKEFVRDSTDTMNRRNRNANAINVSAGNKGTLSQEDLDSMLNRKNII